MKDRTYDTIIVGAGISGLACAKKLNNHNNDFLIISRNIGGRILTSDDGKANYGAFFVCSDYKNVLNYVKLKDRIRLRDFCFHQNNETYQLFDFDLIKYISQFLKTYKMLYKFRKKLRNLRLISENISQKKAIENDSFLYELYMKKASDFVRLKNIESGTNRYLSKALYSTTFSEITHMNAFSFLQFLIPLITPIYRFKFEKEKMIKPFKEKIILKEVTDIKYKNKRYKIKTDEGFFNSKNIVLATDISWSKKYAKIKKVNKTVNTNMVHVKAVPNNIISNKKFHLFSPPGNVQAIANLGGGSYLFYYKEKIDDVNNYFIKPKIIGKKRWEPAGTINGHNLIECNRGNNMFLIGDYNIAGLEESYITGLYCANQIIYL